MLLNMVSIFWSAILRLKAWAIKSDREKFESFESGCVRVCKICRYLRPLIVFLLIGFVLWNVPLSEDYTYEQQMHQIANDIEGLLVDEKICSSQGKCRGHKFFVSPYPSGMAIVTYGITSKEVMTGITKLAINQFSAHKGMTVVFLGMPFRKKRM